MSPDPALRVLVADDDDAVRKTLARVLQRAGCVVSTAADGAEGFEQLQDGDFDVAVVDVCMPRMDGPELLARAKSHGIDAEIIVMTASGDVELAVATVRAGAFEFLAKPFVSNEAVTIAVRNAAQRRRLARRTRELEEALQTKQGSQNEMLGSSRAMNEVLRLVEGVATASSTVLILGESGTGKELVARAIHRRSRRADKPLITVNCAALPEEELVESELFGHVRGAFTGAQVARTGLFEAADGGTLFLDEVGDLPIAAQVKLLRTLQFGEVRRVGADAATHVDVRVVAATNVDLQEAIIAGTFRKDLFYRLNVITVHVPPLRARREDIALLAFHFLTRFASAMSRPATRFAPETLCVLEDYDWPGNVRELEHAIEHAVVLTTGECIEPAALPFRRPAGAPSVDTPKEPPTAHAATTVTAVLDVSELFEVGYTDAKARLVTLFTEAYVEELLRRSDNNMSEAARLANLDRSNFRRLARRGERKSALALKKVGRGS